MLVQKVCTCVEAGVSQGVGKKICSCSRNLEKKKATFILVERLNQSQQREQVFSHLNPPMGSLADALLLACSELILNISAIGRLILLPR